MVYYVGLDIGTSSTKAVAFAPAGNILARHAVHYSLLQPQPGFSELDPDELLSATLSCLQSLADLLGSAPAFISFSAAMHGFMAVNQSGKPLTNLITWADTRASEQAAALHLALQAKNIYEKTGVPVHPMSPLCKLLWLKEVAPGIFANTAKFIGIKEYIFHHFSGSYVVDVSVASATGMFHTKNGGWDEEILNMLGITTVQLPDIVLTSFNFPVTNKLLHWLKDVRIVAGASDGALSNIGTGAERSDQLSITIGTSAAARILSREWFLDPEMRCFCYLASVDTYIIGGASNNGGVVLQWLSEKLFHQSDHTTLLAEAFAIPAGADGLLMLPYLLGERAPLWNASARASFIGVGWEHTRAHFVRAALEAICYNLRHISSIIANRFPIKSLIASGGFVQSPEWLQLLADICNQPVCSAQDTDSAALGAVIVGAAALGQEFHLTQSDTTIYLPNPDLTVHYQQHYHRFLKYTSLLM